MPSRGHDLHRKADRFLEAPRHTGRHVAIPASQTKQVHSAANTVVEPQLAPVVLSILDPVRLTANAREHLREDESLVYRLTLELVPEVERCHAGLACGTHETRSAVNDVRSGLAWAETGAAVIPATAQTSNHGLIRIGISRKFAIGSRQRKPPPPSRATRGASSATNTSQFSDSPSWRLPLSWTSKEDDPYDHDHAAQTHLDH